MALKIIDSAEITNKNVIARFDFNVPLDSADSEVITDTTRIDAALDTIRYVLEQKPNKLVLMGHLGRPKGKVNAAFSLLPVAKYLAEQLDEEITLTESALDSGIKTLLTLNTNRIIILENLRFHPEETQDDDLFARKLASYGDIYLNDAFGTCHRKHASTHRINAYFPGKNYAGFLIKKEILALSKITDRPQKPFVAISGGAKISDKIKVLEGLLVSVDHMLIGGGMAYPFLKAQGVKIGASMCSAEDVALAKSMLALSSGAKIVLPIDHIACAKDDFAGTPHEIPKAAIPDELMGLDIGPKTIELFRSKLLNAKTVLWNGPMGVFEKKAYANGTFKMADTLAELKAFTLVGGGDSVAAVNARGLANKMSHVSTGGGASLEFIEKGSLPGINALKFGLD